MKPGMKGRIIRECFLCTAEDDQFPTANEQFRDKGQFKIVGAADDYIVVNFEDDDADYFISEDEYKNIEILG